MADPSSKYKEIVHSLKEGAGFELNEQRGDVAFFKYLDATMGLISFIGNYSLLVVPGVQDGSPSNKVGLSKKDYDKSVKIIDDSLEATSSLLDGVLDLTEDECNAFTSEQYLAIEISESVDNSFKSKTSLATAKATKKKEISDPFPPTVTDKQIPFIPTSSLCTTYCKYLFDLQIRYQEFQSKLQQTKPKGRASAIFLRMLIEIWTEIKHLGQYKLEMEQGLLMSEGMLITEIGPLMLARQITVIQWSLWTVIGSKDQSVESNIKESLKKMTQLSTYLTQWCQYEVLRYSNPHDRAEVFGHFIKCANQLRNLGNWEGVDVIVNGLMDTPIARLKSTMKLVDGEQFSSFLELQELLSPNAQYSKMENEIIKQNKRAIIPLLARWKVMRDIVPPPPTAKSPWDFVPAIIEQHYILTQPFRFKEELMKLSMEREPNGGMLMDRGGDDVEDVDYIALEDRDKINSISDSKYRLLRESL